MSHSFTKCYTTAKHWAIQQRKWWTDGASSHFQKSVIVGLIQRKIFGKKYSVLQ